MARIPQCDLLDPDVNRTPARNPLENTTGESEPDDYGVLVNRFAQGKLTLERFKSRLLDLFSPIYRAIGSKEAPASILLRASAGQLRAQMEKEINDLIMPLARLLEKMGKAGVDLSFFERYLYAKHTLHAPPDMPPTGMSEEEARFILDSFENMEPNKKALIQEAEEILQKIRTREIALRIEGGLLPAKIKDQDTIEYLKQKYPNYVPLWDLDEDISPKPILGYGPLGFDLKRANEYYRREGRTGYARGSLIGRFIAALEQAIVRRQKNLVLQEVIEELSRRGLARVFTEKYLQADSEGKVFVPYVSVKGLIDSNPLVVSKVPDGAWVDRENKIVDGGSEFNTFVFKKEGMAYYAYIEDPDIARSLRRMNLLGLMLAYDYGSIVGLLNRFTTLFRHLATSYNPAFIVLNFVRDQLGAPLKTFMEIGPNAFKHWPRAVAIALKSAWLYHIKGDRTSELAQEFEKFRLLGGITGFYGRQLDMAATARKIRQYYQMGLEGKLNWKKVFRKIGDLLGRVQDLNTLIEESTRYAAYLVAKKESYTERHAILLARNVTVDFNRQGEYGSILSSFYVFFNARLQGAYNLLEYLTDKGPRGKRARLVAAYLAGLGFLWAMIARILMGVKEDEDDLQDGRKPVTWSWDQIPFYTRMNYIVLPLVGDPNNFYVRIPLPPGLHVFWAAGVAAESIAYMFARADMAASEKEKTAFRAAWSLVDAAIDGFAPISAGDAKDPSRFFVLSFSPTIIRPLAEVAVNSNFFGSPVYPDPELNRARPIYELAWKRTSIWSRELSRGLHEFLGVESPFFSPAAIEHIARGYTAGVGSFVANTLYTIERLFTAGQGRPIDSGDIARLPVVGSLTGTEPEYVIYKEYYDLRYEIADIGRRIRMLQAGVRDRAYRVSNEEIRYYYSVRNISSSLDGAIRRYRDIMRKIEISGNLSDGEKLERIEKLEKEILRTMKRHNRIVREAKLKIEKEQG